MKKINLFINVFFIVFTFFSCKNISTKEANTIENKIEKSSEIPSKYYGNFYAGVETEATTTGMASISYYFTISKKEVYLETNTYHEPIRCNGKYRGKMNNNILELFYIGTEQNCGNDYSNFKIKNEGEKFYIQGLGGEGTFNVWLELKKIK